MSNNPAKYDGALRATRTTDLEMLRANKPFTWGKTVQIIDCGPYTFVEAIAWDTEGVSINTGWYHDDNRRNFYIFMNGQPIHQFAYSLDTAMALAIAYKHEGPNSQAAHYFMKMIGA